MHIPVLQVNYVLPMTPQGNTALIYACQKEDISSVQFLNNLGTNPNVCNKVIFYGVHHFTFYTYLDMCNVLLKLCVAY